MEDSVIARRADDLVISVRQDNDARSVSISGINERALALLGFDDTQSVVGTSLYSILDPRTKDIVSSYLEFTDDGTDLSEVVSKIRGFTLLNSKLQPVSVRPKIFRTTSSRGILNYEILIRDTSLSQKLDAFRASKLPENSRYTMHESFGIMDEASTATEIGVVLDFVNSSGVNAVICMIAADPTAHSSGSSLVEMLDRTLSDTISENIRYTDISGYFGERKFVFMLLGCDNASAYSAVSRVHGSVCNKLSSRCSPPATASAAYAQMQGSNLENMVTGLKRTLLAAQKETQSVKLVM
ncbi:MAG: hypothetical protein AB8U69_02980 [Anaplasma ovis]|uniref:GGDEF domain-containing protein n=2 Tax=cellular organisms TaxID=131567 RepID=A0A6A6JZN7_HEVBR|nr:hypothetical protein [Anaplasma ovis]ASI47887.1 hypothetical protein AOV_03620 [Anaplasma ovis str. Haibei]KAF2282041.1 hypothetical protein GH714_042865 [Hevea brasiliensis]